MMRKFWIAILLVVLCIGVCGCMSNQKQNQAETTRERALEYLRSNYEDVFTAQAYSANNWAYRYESVTFTSKKYPGATVEVRVYQNEDNSVTFVDNYFHCYMMQDAVDYSKSLLGTNTVSVKVRFSNSIWSDDLVDAKSFTQWKELGNCEMDVFVIAKEALSQNEQTAFMETLVLEKITGMVTFFTTSDAELLVDYTLDDVLNNQSKLIQSRSQYYVNSITGIQKK